MAMIPECQVKIGLDLAARQIMLMLTEDDDLVACPSPYVKPGMVVEYGRTSTIRETLWTRANTPEYRFAVQMSHQDEPFQATRVYSQCWQAQ